MIHKGKYKFSVNTLSKRGLLSTVCGILSFFSLIGALFMVLRDGGALNDRLGAIGFVSSLFSVTGVILGIKSLDEEDTLKFIPWIGMVTSMVSMMAWGVVVYVGMG